MPLAARQCQSAFAAQSHRLNRDAHRVQQMRLLNSPYSAPPPAEPPNPPEEFYESIRVGTSTSATRKLLLNSQPVVPAPPHMTQHVGPPATALWLG